MNETSKLIGIGIIGLTIGLFIGGFIMGIQVAEIRFEKEEQYGACYRIVKTCYENQEGECDEAAWKYTDLCLEAKQ